MAKKRTRFDSNLMLVGKDRSRTIYLTFPLSMVTRWREEAKARGVTLNEYIVSLLNLPKAKRSSRTKKKRRPSR